jgi:hypothetical protein
MLGADLIVDSQAILKIDDLFSDESGRIISSNPFDCIPPDIIFSPDSIHSFF